MSIFQFKHFSVTQADNAMKVGTDAMLLGSLAAAENPSRILDIGSGTGVLALMAAQRFANAYVCGVEIDAKSAAEGSANFRNNPWSQRMEMVRSNFLEFQSESPFDLVLSNPPFYQSRLENLDARLAQSRHESALPVEAMLERVGEILASSGAFWVIIPIETQNHWVQTAQTKGLFPAKEISIQGNPKAETKRVILCFSKNQQATTQSHFMVRNLDGSYSKEYIELTKEFHGKSLG